MPTLDKECLVESPRKSHLPIWAGGLFSDGYRVTQLIFMSFSPARGSDMQMHIVWKISAFVCHTRCSPRCSHKTDKQTKFKHSNNRCSTQAWFPSQQSHSDRTIFSLISVTITNFVLKYITTVSEFKTDYRPDAQTHKVISESDPTWQVSISWSGFFSLQSWQPPPG